MSGRSLRSQTKGNPLGVIMERLGNPKTAHRARAMRVVTSLLSSTPSDVDFSGQLETMAFDERMSQVENWIALIKGIQSSTPSIQAIESSTSTPTNAFTERETAIVTLFNKVLDLLAAARNHMSKEVLVLAPVAPDFETLAALEVFAAVLGSELVATANQLAATGTFPIRAESSGDRYSLETFKALVRWAKFQDRPPNLTSMSTVAPQQLHLYIDTVIRRRPDNTDSKVAATLRDVSESLYTACFKRYALASGLTVLAAQRLLSRIIQGEGVDDCAQDSLETLFVAGAAASKSSSKTARWTLLPVETPGSKEELDFPSRAAHEQREANTAQKGKVGYEVEDARGGYSIFLRTTGGPVDIRHDQRAGQSDQYPQILSAHAIDHAAQLWLEDLCRTTGVVSRTIGLGTSQDEIEALRSWLAATRKVPVAATHQTLTADVNRASSPSPSSLTSSADSCADRYRTESPDGSSSLTSLGSSLADLSEAEEYANRGTSDISQTPEHTPRGAVHEKLVSHPVVKPVTGQVSDGDRDLDTAYVAKSVDDIRREWNLGKQPDLSDEDVRQYLIGKTGDIAADGIHGLIDGLAQGICTSRDPPIHPQRIRAGLSTIRGPFNLDECITLDVRRLVKYLYAHICLDTQGVEAALPDEVGDPVVPLSSHTESARIAYDLRRYLYRIQVHIVSHSHPHLAGDIGWTFEPIGETDLVVRGTSPSANSPLAFRFLMDHEAFVDIDAAPRMPTTERGWKEKMVVGLAELSDLGCHTSLMKAYKAQIRSLGSDPESLPDWNFIADPKAVRYRMSSYSKRIDGTAKIYRGEGEMTLVIKEEETPYRFLGIVLDSLFGRQHPVEYIQSVEKPQVQDNGRVYQVQDGTALYHISLNV